MEFIVATMLDNSIIYAQFLSQFSQGNNLILILGQKHHL